MEESEAQRIADGLRRYGIMAKVARPAAFRFGIRVPLGDGREALFAWRTDSAELHDLSTTPEGQQALPRYRAQIMKLLGVGWPPPRSRLH